MNDVMLQCPQCECIHYTTEEYLQTYGDAALFCGCGEKMHRVELEVLTLDDPSIQHC